MKKTTRWEDLLRILVVEVDILPHHWSDGWIFRTGGKPEEKPEAVVRFLWMKKIMEDIYIYTYLWLGDFWVGGCSKIWNISNIYSYFELKYDELPKTNSSPLKIGHPKRKRKSIPTIHFPRRKCYLVLLKNPFVFFWWTWCVWSFFLLLMATRNPASTSCQWLFLVPLKGGR